MNFWRLAAAAAAILLTDPSFAQDYPEMTLRYSSNIPEVVNTSKIDLFFSSEIEKRSGGKIKIQHFWANTLGGEAEIVDLTGSGAIDLALIVSGNQVSRLPFAAVTNSLPRTFTDGPKLIELTRYLYENNPTIEAEFAAANLQPLLYRYLPDYRFYCTAPLRTMADFRNKKIRSYGAYVPLMVEALGAVPVNIPPTDMIQAMSTGALDCTYLFNSAVGQFKIDQVAKYGTDISLGVINAHTLFTSRDKWNSWPESVRTLFTEVARDAEAYGIKLIAEDEAKAEAAMVVAGMEIVPFEEMDELSAIIPNMLDAWVAKMADGGKQAEASEMANYITTHR